MKSALLLLSLLAAATSLPAATDYPVRPVPFTAVQIQPGFWFPRFETNRQRTVWYDFEKCEETGRIDNFAKAARLMEGKHKGDPFDDSDVFKVIEGAAYTLALHPDEKLKAYTAALIDKIAAAQEPDGYLYTARTIHPENPPGRASNQRWLNERGALGHGDSHELYNAGHMYEAAVAWFEATGTRKFLNVALKHADLVAKTWGPNPGQLKIPSGHQEIEIGLVKLFRVTQDRKYLDLAKFLLDCRGRNFNDPNAARKPNPYYADHIPVTDQDEAVGHAVRTAYMYSSMADVAALTGDPAYLAAVDRLWDNVVGKKLHLTGGIGALPAGEAFGGNYDLPNASSYNETCAAIANALWNHRMFLLHGDAKYIDVLERVIYNGFLSGLAISGDRFFYPNPLESDGKAKFNHGNNERAPWFGCSCCPVNDVRFVPSIAGYIYATREKALFVNLFIAGSAKCDINGTPVTIKQETRYPWNGKVTLTIAELGAASSDTSDFTLQLRIPGWARNQAVPSDLYSYDDSQSPKVALAVNGKTTKYTLDKGYAQLTRSWKAGDTVTLDLDMPVRRVVSHAAVKANTGRFAIERGPLVYCVEGADNAGSVLDTTLPGSLTFRTEPKTDLLGGIVTIQIASRANGTRLTAIPYYAWCHRGANEMRVWHPTQPQPKLASHCWEQDSIEAAFDGKEPKTSNDTSLPRFTWWPRTGSTEWIVRQFKSPTRVTAAQLYWFDDSGAGACRAPQSWRLYYLDGQRWKPVEKPSPYGTALNQYNQVTFTPVTTTALKLEVQLPPNFSSGILEWK
ncbi:MAG TPA: beta-L-arabinofuranosidase domain-containing protein [Clostridia bacterium]|nr:beta-L-arabinofuranosidase domain-containing protein [Clostridia bacterium]